MQIKCISHLKSNVWLLHLILILWTLSPLHFAFLLSSAKDGIWSFRHAQSRSSKELHPSPLLLLRLPNEQTYSYSQCVQVTPDSPRHHYVFNSVPLQNKANGKVLADNKPLNLVQWVAWRRTPSLVTALLSSDYMLLGQTRLFHFIPMHRISGWVSRTVAKIVKFLPWSVSVKFLD